MARLLPSTPDLSAADEAEPRVVGIEGDDADELLAAMSSRTARELLLALHDEPGAPSELADRVGTSLQNAQYHLGNLSDAGLIEVIDTVYSEKGREMKVYAPADRPLVVVAADEAETASLRSMLGSLVGGLAGLAVVSLLVHVLLGGSLRFATLVGGTGGAADGGDGGVGTADAEVAAESTRAAAETAATLPPGLLFFAGGAVVLFAVVAVWYWRRR